MLGQVVIRLAAPETVRVRYGRSTLTIAVRGGLTPRRLGAAIAAYGEGRLTADELCSQFARRRIRGHSPGFAWETADMQRVLSLSWTPHRIRF